MGKGLGIAALVLAIIAIFVPFAGSWLTIVVALLAVFAVGEGFGLGVAAIIINFLHIFFFSPLLWATQGLLEGRTAQTGEEFVFFPWFLIGIQIIAFVALGAA
jgi:hypothetical protein